MRGSWVLFSRMLSAGRESPQGLAMPKSRLAAWLRKAASERSPVTFVFLRLAGLRGLRFGLGLSVDIAGSWNECANKIGSNGKGGAWGSAILFGSGKWSGEF